MNTIENPRNPGVITAFTTDNVYLPPFPHGTFERERVEKLFGQSDFYKEAYDSLVRDEHLQRPEIRKSEELKTFLQENRPQILFFLPQDISNILTPESNIIVNRRSGPNEFLWLWEFGLNPEKHELDPILKQTITLTTIQKQGRYAVQEPYLVVGFPARYEEPNVIFYPKIKITWGDMLPRNKVEVEMIKLYPSFSSLQVPNCLGPHTYGTVES